MQVHYIPIYRFPYYRDTLGYPQDTCPHAEEYYASAISLPMYPSLSRSDVERVVAELTRLLGLQGPGEGGVDHDPAVDALNILITSLSRKVPLLNAVRQALIDSDSDGVVWGADSDPECVGHYFADRFWPMPRLDRDDAARACSPSALSRRSAC